MIVFRILPFAEVLQNRHDASRKNEQMLPLKTRVEAPACGDLARGAILESKAAMLHYRLELFVHWLAICRLAENHSAGSIVGKNRTTLRKHSCAVVEVLVSRSVSPSLTSSAYLLLSKFLDISLLPLKR